MSSDSGVNGVEDKLVSVKEHIVDYSNDTAANVTIDNENNGSYVLGSDNSHHSVIFSATIDFHFHFYFHFNCRR